MYVRFNNGPFISNVFAYIKHMCANREELLADPSLSAPDISYLGVWSGEQSRLEKLIRTLKPKYSIALDVDTGMPCMHVTCTSDRHC